MRNITLKSCASLRAHRLEDIEIVSILGYWDSHFSKPTLCGFADDKLEYWGLVGVLTGQRHRNKLQRSRAQLTSQVVELQFEPRQFNFRVSVLNQYFCPLNRNEMIPSHITLIGNMSSTEDGFWNPGITGDFQDHFSKIAEMKAWFKRMDQSEVKN